MAFLFFPQPAHAQDAGGTFGGITSFLKSITQLFIYDWGYYIGIPVLSSNDKGVALMDEIIQELKTNDPEQWGLYL